MLPCNFTQPQLSDFDLGKIGKSYGKTHIWTKINPRLLAQTYLWKVGDLSSVFEILRSGRGHESCSKEPAAKDS